MVSNTKIFNIRQHSKYINFCSVHLYLNFRVPTDETQRFKKAIKKILWKDKSQMTFFFTEQTMNFTKIVARIRFINRWMNCWIKDFKSTERTDELVAISTENISHRNVNGCTIMNESLKWFSCIQNVVENRWILTDRKDANWEYFQRGNQIRTTMLDNVLQWQVKDHRWHLTRNKIIKWSISLDDFYSTDSVRNIKGHFCWNERSFLFICITTQWVKWFQR